MERLRIGILHHRVANFQGGTEVRCLGEAKWLAENGHAVTLYALAGGDSPLWRQTIADPAFRSVNVREVRVGEHDRSSIDAEFKAAAVAAGPEMERSDDELTMVYYSSTLRYLPVSGPWVLRLQGAPPVASLREGMLTAGQRLRGVICNSQPLVTLARTAAEGVWNGIIEYLPGGVWPPTLPPAAGPPRFDVCVVLRLIDRKDPATLGDAILALLRLRPNARICVVGDGPHRPQLAERFRTESSSHYVRMLGEIPQGVVMNVIRSSRVLLHTALEDSCPNAVQEALREGVPVVAPDLPSLRDLVLSGRTGYLVPPEQGGEGLAAQIDSILADDALHRRLATASRIDASRFYWSRVGPELVRLLTEIRDDRF